jgi:long-chain acyl-CoA synthetase
MELFQQRISACLQDCAPHEQVRLLTLLGQGWTPETEEMTHSFKLKRGVIERNFAAEIARMYAS